MTTGWTLGDWARHYVTLGWYVFPLQPGAKVPFAGSRGVRNATCDVAQIDAWWHDVPAANIGLAPAPSGMVVVDIDAYHADCVAPAGWESIATLRALTPRGGVHLYFAAVPGARYARKVTGCRRVDVICDGFYCLTPPSVVDGIAYRWDDGSTAPVSPPEWLALHDTAGDAWHGAPRGDLAVELRRADDDADLTEVMSRIPNDDLDWDDWNRVGMACFVASAGSDAGHAAWHRWSSRSEKYDPIETEARWKHYFRSPPAGIGIGTLVHLATPRDPRDSVSDNDQGDGDDRDDGGDFGTILTAEEQARYFAGCVAISGMGRIFTPRGQFLDAQKFAIEYGGREFIWHETKPPTDDAWKAATRGQRWRVPVAQSVQFRPDIPVDHGQMFVDELGRQVVNTYIPARVDRTVGDVSVWLDHIGRMLPHGDDAAILLAYCASLVQNPGTKFQWCPVIQGCEGNGKSTILRCLERAVGRVYTHHPNARQLTDGGQKFNAWLQNKILIAVEEVRVGDRRDMLDVLKPLVTDDRIEMQAKGIDQQDGDNRANFVMCSNFKDAIPVDEGSRRYAILYTAQQSVADLLAYGMDEVYFARLYDWLNGGGYAHVTQWLMTHDVPVLWDPARGARRAPRTTSTNEALALSRGALETLILECVEDDVVGFRGGWISSIMLRRRMIDEGMGRIGHVAVARALESLGYQSVGRYAGRALIQEDGKRPRLWARDGAAHDYADAQGYASA